MKNQQSVEHESFVSKHTREGGELKCVKGICSKDREPHFQVIISSISLGAAPCGA